MRAQVCWVEDDGRGGATTPCGQTSPRSFTAMDREITCVGCMAALRARDAAARDETRHR